MPIFSCLSPFSLATDRQNPFQSMISIKRHRSIAMDRCKGKLTTDNALSNGAGKRIRKAQADQSGPDCIRSLTIDQKRTRKRRGNPSCKNAKAPKRQNRPESMSDNVYYVNFKGFWHYERIGSDSAHNVTACAKAEHVVPPQRT